MKTKSLKLIGGILVVGCFVFVSALLNNPDLSLTKVVYGYGGGGGGWTSPTPSGPSTTDGQVTASSYSGGSTTYSNPDGGSALLSIPGAAISGATTFTVTSLSEGSVSSAPSGLFMIGSHIYQITAEAYGSAVTSFDSSLTLTVTYTDDQIEGFEESNLEIYYYDTDLGSWIALDTTIDTTNNKATASVIHFTNFSLMGGEAEETTTTEEETTSPEETEEETTTTKSISEMTIEELQDMINDILSQIAVLQTQLVTVGGGSYSGIPSSFSFSGALSQGMVSDAVKYLQIALNASADTRLASSGVGSPGNETTYFGSLTKAAVVKFQEKYSSSILSPWGLSSGTGYVGQTTIERLNAMIGK